MKVHFLGTGTSTGVPQIGCSCETCLSEDRKDKRLRSSVYITIGDTHLMIDAGPDLRQQVLANGIDKPDGILITHEHYDHIGGLDDIRPFGNTTVYAEERVLLTIKKNMSYSFADKKYPGVPQINLIEITTQTFRVKGVDILPVRVMHAQLGILGFRIGDMAYLTDVKTIDEDSIEKLKNLKVLILNSLRHADHIAHLSLTESLELVKKMKPQKAYLTHLSHDMGQHEKIELNLPKNVRIAYDGLELYI